jgi:hypothetical protein
MHISTSILTKIELLCNKIQKTFPLQDIPGIPAYLYK